MPAPAATCFADIWGSTGLGATGASVGAGALGAAAGRGLRSAFGAAAFFAGRASAFDWLDCFDPAVVEAASAPAAALVRRAGFAAVSDFGAATFCVAFDGVPRGAFGEVVGVAVAVATGCGATGAADLRRDAFAAGASEFATAAAAFDLEDVLDLVFGSAEFAPLSPVGVSAMHPSPVLCLAWLSLHGIGGLRNALLG